ncbi:MAG: T9SS type A sorting domain-containing protein [Bacteroidales bacterium]|nr:T9SS type A sorting domain-containing protein [Bacteroidales bacterium]
MKTKFYLFTLLTCLFMTLPAIAQTAYTGLADGDYRIATLDSSPLYLTGGTATIAGLAPTFSALITPNSDTQIWTLTKGTTGNGTDKYFIKSKNEVIPINAQGTLKLTAAGAKPTADGKFHANTIYMNGDTYAIKVAAGVIDATTTYTAKFWLLNGSTLGVTTTTAAVPVAADYIVKFIPQDQWTGINATNENNKRIAVTASGIQIISNESSVVSVYNSVGKSVKQISIRGNDNISLTKGIYLVRIKSNCGTSTQKVIIL